MECPKIRVFRRFYNNLILCESEISHNNFDRFTWPAIVNITKRTIDWGTSWFTSRTIYFWTWTRLKFYDAVLFQSCQSVPSKFWTFIAIECSKSIDRIEIRLYRVECGLVVGKVLTYWEMLLIFAIFYSPFDR